MDSDTHGDITRDPSPDLTRDMDAAALYLRAISNPTDDTMGALRAVLADDVRAAGMLTSGLGVDAVIASIRAAPPMAAAATWSDPEIDGDTTRIRGTLPPGAAVSDVVVHVRVSGEHIAEVVQEVTLAPPPPATELRLDDAITAVINDSSANGTPFVVGYVGTDGAAHVSFRGSVHVHSPKEVAMWIRDPLGGLVNAIASHPAVGLLYRDPKTRATYEMNGMARVVHDDEARASVYERSPAFDRNLDPMRRGVAVVVRVTRLLGGAPGDRVHMTEAPR